MSKRMEKRNMWKDIEGEFGTLKVNVCNPRVICVYSERATFRPNPNLSKAYRVEVYFEYETHEYGLEGSWDITRTNIYGYESDSDTYQVVRGFGKESDLVIKGIRAAFSSWINLNQELLDKYTKDWMLTTLLKLNEMYRNW